MTCLFVQIDESEIPALEKDGKRLSETLFNAKEAASLDIDKSWHGIHYLLTQEAWSTRGDFGQVILGGREIGENWGYGPARVLSAAQVKMIAKKLKALPIDTLQANYDPKAMNRLEIYPEVWTSEGKEGLAYLIEYYKKLVRFYEQAAAKGKALLIVIV